MSPSALGMIRLMRPRQWIKNGFVLAPLFFSEQILNLDDVRAALFSALLFCAASSIAYIINDYNDIESDRRHPVKSKKRPLASGQASKAQAFVLLGILSLVLIWGYVQRPDVMAVVLSYIALNLLYTFVLRNQPILDIFSIALGFVLRVYGGGVALEIDVTSWMFITTFSVALYLAAIKRRQELLQSGKDGREVLNQYSEALVARYAEMAATGAIVFYSIFVLTTRPELVASIPVVLFGLFRYWYVVEALDGGESPTDVLFSDWQLGLTIVLWICMCVWLLWPLGDVVT